MLTHRQKQVRDFVEKTISRKSVAPSEREIAKHFRIAPSTVHEHLKEIEERGYLNRNPGKRRGISIRKNEGLIKIPLLGAIAAGEPIHVFEEQRETIAVPKSKIYSSSEVYALRVVGNSMVDENINDGDIILVKQQTTAENGQKVVALLNGNEATLKTFYKEKGQIRLQPANKNFQPIIVKNGQELALQGVLLDVIKTNETERPAQTLISPSQERSQQRGKITSYLNKVYNGDVMRVLKDLPDNSVDMIFGDPDYNVGIKYGENNYTKK